ncbi:hypothetical protein GC194_07155 [bacterium]|nr:hypothetical protein [bacterium]
MKDEHILRSDIVIWLGNPVDSLVVPDKLFQDETFNQPLSLSLAKSSCLLKCQDDVFSYKINQYQNKLQLKNSDTPLFNNHSFLQMMIDGKQVSDTIVPFEFTVNGLDTILTKNNSIYDIVATVNVSEDDLYYLSYVNTGYSFNDQNVVYKVPFVPLSKGENKLSKRSYFNQMYLSDSNSLSEKEIEWNHKYINNLVENDHVGLTDKNNFIMANKMKSVYEKRNNPFLIPYNEFDPNVSFIISKRVYYKLF